MVIFKSKRMSDTLKEDAPPGSPVINNDSSWMDHDSFIACIHHFQLNWLSTNNCLLEVNIDLAKTDDTVSYDASLIVALYGSESWAMKQTDEKSWTLLRCGWGFE